MFELGGEEYRLTSYDYTLQESDGGCLSMLLPNGGSNVVMLGGGILRGLHAVFDLERDMVGCESPVLSTRSSWRSNTL